MALSWNLEKIKKEVWFEVTQETLDQEKEDKKKNPNKVSLFMRERRVHEDGKTYELKGEVNMIIWLSMNVGMDEITEKNYEKFYNRLHLLENTIETKDGLKGAYLTITEKVGKKEVVKPYQYTKEMVKELIGLKTNATKLTKSQFLKIALRMEL
tara:strand:- start:272 stop:733 length:462 start_codon:yes stop_codon:yes gene_type:complete